MKNTTLLKSTTLALTCFGALASLSSGALYVWNSSGGVGQDADWSNTANWSGGIVPVDRIAGTGNNNGLTFDATDSITFAGTTVPATNFPGLGGTTTTNGDTPTMIFNSGGTFNFDFNGRETSIWSNNGSRTIFTVGDGLGGGTEDVSVNLTGLNYISRHAGATNNFIINSDGELNFNAGVDFIYPNTTNRLSTFTIVGGDVNFAGGLVDFTANAGTFVDFTALDGTFSALYGESNGYADATAVQAALDAGVNWKNNSGGTLLLTDNGTGFTVTAVPEPSSTALLGLGALGMLVRRRRA